MADFGSLAPDLPAGSPQAPGSSIAWLRQYLPTPVGDWMARKEQEGLAQADQVRSSPAKYIGGEMIQGAMNLLPAGRMAVPRPGIRAYHGSPYDFDRFDMSKIGSGEGAQAYGHGLYFAENPKVAAEYKAKLSPQNNDEALAQTFAHKNGMDWSNMSIFDKQSLIDHVSGNPDFLGMNVDRLPKGKMYEVNINAKPDQFLDWSKTLAEQSAPVHRSFENLRDTIKQENPYAQSGLMLENARTNNIPFEDFNRQFAKYDFDPISAADMMRDSGIPGSRYLDQGSRFKEGAGTSNYVLFNDSIIDILRKYGLAGGMAGAGAAAGNDQAQASPFGSLAP